MSFWKKLFGIKESIEVPKTEEPKIIESIEVKDNQIPIQELP